MAFTVIGMSPWPVIKMIGTWMFPLANSVWNSSPLCPGSRISSTRQLGMSASLLARNSGGVANVLTCKPTDRNRPLSVSRTASSSSMTYTTDWVWDRSTIVISRKVGGKVPYSVDPGLAHDRADGRHFPFLRTPWKADYRPHPTATHGTVTEHDGDRHLVRDGRWCHPPPTAGGVGAICLHRRPLPGGLRLRR